MYAIIVIDYLTKWVEAEPLAKITKANTTKFIWNNVVCRHGIPTSIVTDNGRQFDKARLRDIRNQLGINKTFSSPDTHKPMAKWRQ